MCLHSAYEVGGVVYVRGLDPKPARGSDSNTRSSAERVVRQIADTEATLHIRLPRRSSGDTPGGAHGGGEVGGVSAQESTTRARRHGAQPVAQFA